MPAGTVLDYSGWRPTWQQYTQMRADGIVGVVRYVYLGPGTEWKAMNKPEYDTTLSFGFQISFTPELSNDTWLGGKPKGIEIGKKARDWVRGLGFPDSQPLHYAVDTDVVPLKLSVALSYLEGCALGDEGPKCSAYGETSVIDGAFERGITQNGWRAAATSWDTNPSKHASMRQTTQRSYPYAGSYDENITTGSDWGQHPYTGANMPLPFSLWNDGVVWRVDAGGQSKVRVPDLQQIAFNFDQLKNLYGATQAECQVRDAIGEAKRWLDAIPESGRVAVTLPPLPPYPVPPTAAENGAAAAAAVKPLLNAQKIVVP
jgi:hypothetical protein